LIHDEQVTFGVADEVGEFGFKVSCTLESAKKLMEKNRVFRGGMPICTCRKGPLRNSKINGVSSIRSNQELFSIFFTAYFWA
jgi:hypothetical protein